MKRIKHRDLTHYFLTMSIACQARAYVASCEKFFKELSDKQQASSGKRQASSLKRQA
jgi:hypothetical protein